MKKLITKIETWLDKAPRHALTCFLMMLLVVWSAVSCNYMRMCMIQLDALKVIQKTYVQAVNGCMPITYRQTQDIGEIYDFAVSGLSDLQRQSVDYKIEKIAEAYYEYQESLYRDRDGLFAPNDDPGPGVHVDDNGWKADIAAPFLPPARTADGKTISNTKDNPAGPWSGPTD